MSGVLIIAFLLEVFSQSFPQILTNSSDPSNQIKGIIIGCFVFALFIFFLVCLYILVSTQDKKKFDFAQDAIKALTGFFIGAITGFFA